MVLTSVVLTLMVLYCGQDTDFNVFWDTSGTLNDPTGDKHTMELKTIVAEGKNFKSSQVVSWTSLGLETVRISAVSVYGDIWWTTEFNATLVGPLLENWALGGANLLYSTSYDTPSLHDTVFNQSSYRLIIYPSYILPLNYAWFAVTVSPLSYSGLPLAFIAKQPSSPFRLPDIVDGYLGCYPSSQITNLTFTKSDPSASYEICLPECSSSEFNVVIMKGSTECNCGVLSDNPSGEDSSYCFLNCPGNNTQRCGGFDSNWQSVYHLPGPENMPGAYKSGTVYTGSHSNNITIDIDIADLQSKTGDPAFISNISVTAAPASKTYRIFYSAEPCSGSTPQQLTTKRENLTNFAADGSNVDVDMIMVRCLRIVMSDIASSIDVNLIGPINTELISVPVLAIQGVKTTDVTTTTTTTTTQPPPTTTTTTTLTTITTSSTTTTPSTTTSTSTTSTTTTTIPPTTSTSTPTSTSTSSTTTTTTTTPISTTVTSSTPTSVTSTTTPATTTSLTSNGSTTSQPTVVGASTTTTDTQTTSTVQTTESSTTSSTTQPTCMCNCSDIVSYTNMTTAELQEKIRAIQQHLAVNTTTLSSYIRAKTSAQDNRPSAISIGALGAGLLIAVFGLVLLIDSTILFKDLRMLTRNIRGLFSE